MDKRELKDLLSDPFVMTLIEEVERPLSDTDLKRAFNYQVNLILYNELQNYRSINDLLDPFGRAIILYEWADNQGHWTGLHRTVEGIEFFDPYGYVPDDERKFIPKRFWKHGYLTRLLSDASNRGDSIHYNQYPFQSNNEAVATCGRWVTLRLLHPELSIDQFAKLFFHREQLLNDLVVTYMTKNIFKRRF